MEAREAALKGEWGKVEIGSSRTVAGTVNAGLVSYYQSGAFKALAESTQSMRRAELERFRTDHGDKRIALMHRTAMQAILNGKTPAAARNWKKAMRGFLDHVVSLDMIKVDRRLLTLLPTRRRTKQLRTAERTRSTRETGSTGLRLAGAASANDARTYCYHFATQLPMVGTNPA